MSIKTHSYQHRQGTRGANAISGGCALKRVNLRNSCLGRSCTARNMETRLRVHISCKSYYRLSYLVYFSKCHKAVKICQFIEHENKLKH